MDAIYDAVGVMKEATRDGAVTHCNHISRDSHLVIDHLQSFSHLVGDGAFDHHKVRLSERTQGKNPKSLQIMPRPAGSSELCTAACGSDVDGPERVYAAPVYHVAYRGPVDYCVDNVSELPDPDVDPIGEHRYRVFVGLLSCFLGSRHGSTLSLI